MLKLKILLILLCLACLGAIPVQKDPPPRIQIALILDVSGSMNGLVSQVQSQFWQLLAFLEKAETRKQKPRIELAVLTVGDATAPGDELKIVAPFSSDFDCILTKVIPLQCVGSNEFFGQAISRALDSLAWSDQKQDFRTIVVAGNESFEQGRIDFQEVCKTAAGKNIIINTIYCGLEELGQNFKWPEAASLGQGVFTTINHNDTFNLDTPYDAVFTNIYKNFQNTVIPYHDSTQTADDCNDLDLLNITQRSALSRQYIVQQIQNARLRNDLVTACEKDATFLEKIDPARLPESYRNTPPAKLAQVVQEKIHRRTVLREGVDLYLQKVEEYFDIQYPNRNREVLVAAFQKMLKPQLEAAGFVFVE